MGEAWRDWYAMDFLNNLGLQADTTASGEVRVDGYLGEGQHLARSQPLDCPVGSRSSRCLGTRGPDGAATPTGTSAQSAIGPRCMRMARSGVRRSGTCGPRSGHG